VVVMVQLADTLAVTLRLAVFVVTANTGAEPTKTVREMRDKTERFIESSFSWGPRVG
jgi:hypothetical protein